MSAKNAVSQYMKAVAVLGATIRVTTPAKRATALKRALKATSITAKPAERSSAQSATTLVANEITLNI